MLGRDLFYNMFIDKLKDLWNVSLRIKLDCLVSSIVASHITFTTIDAHFRINQGDYMLPKK